MTVSPRSSSKTSTKNADPSFVEKKGRAKKNPSKHLTSALSSVHGNTMNALHSIELFSGAGGLALGLHAAGFKHLALYEWNPSAVKTLHYNQTMGHASLKDCEIIRADVREIDFSKHQRVDLVAGGPPCQPFSMGGKAAGMNDERDMFPQAVRAVAEIQPRAFIFENVRGLLRPAFTNYVEFIRLQMEFPNFPTSNNVSWDINLARLQRHKERLGNDDAGLRYRVHVHQVNAADYGIPQQRHRVFFIGFRSDVATNWSFPQATHSYASLYFSQYVKADFWRRTGLNPRDYRDEVACLENQANTPKSTAQQSPHHLTPWVTLHEAIRDLPYPSSRVAKKWLNHELQEGARAYPGHTGSPLHRPAKALKAGDHGVPGGENMIVYPDGYVRYFSVRESARVQTFPDNYAFLGSWTEAMRQLGNAVPMELARIVAKSVANALIQDSTSTVYQPTNEALQSA